MTALALYHYRLNVKTGLIGTRTERVPARLKSITDESGLCHGFARPDGGEYVMIPYRGRLEISAVDTPTP